MRMTQKGMSLNSSMRRKCAQAGRSLKAPVLRAGEQRERDDAHGFLRVVGAVTEAHETCAEELGFAKNHSDEPRRQRAASTISRKPINSAAADESGER